MKNNFYDLESIRKELNSRIRNLRFDIANLSSLERQTKKDGGNFARLERNFPKNVSLHYSYYNNEKVDRITIYGMFNHSYHSTDLYLNDNEGNSIDDIYEAINKKVKRLKNLLRESLEDLETLDIRFKQLDELIEQFNKDCKLTVTETDKYILNEYAKYKIGFNR